MQAKWTRKQFDAEKEVVKKKYAEVSVDKDKRARMRFCIKQISALQAEESAGSRMQLYAYIVLALIEHERALSLSDQQVETMSEMAFGVLRSGGIDPESSALADLWADVCLLRSQIYRRVGNHWAAAWEQQRSLRYRRDPAPEHQGFLHYGDGNRVLRLGYSKEAMGYFEKAEKHPVTPEIMSRIQLAKVLSLRLKGDLNSAAELARKALTVPDLDRRVKLELEWEVMCQDFRKTFDLNAMLNAVKRDGSHYLAHYQMETFLWGMALPHKNWFQRLPNMHGMKKNSKLHPGRHKPLYNACLALENWYDVDIPFEQRFGGLSKALLEVHRVFTIDIELLVLAAAARGLYRNRSYALYELTRARYNAYSFLLTHGQSEDALGMFGEPVQDEV